MADNFSVTAGSGTTIAADDISSVYYQRVKVTHGADGSATDVSSSSPLPVVLNPQTTGGWATYHLVSAASTNATVIKASAGQVGGWFIYNSNASALKVAFHNASSTPTAGASIYFSLVIPATSGANVSFPSGIAFSTGIAITTVTELADSGSTAVASGDLLINIWYK